MTLKFFQKKWSSFLVVKNISKENNKIDKKYQTAKVFSKKTGKFISFDGVSYDIWLLIKKEISFTQIVNQLKHIYEIDEEVIKKDLNDFLSKLDQQGLIKYKKLE